MKNYDGNNFLNTNQANENLKGSYCCLLSISSLLYCFDKMVLKGMSHTYCHTSCEWINLTANDIFGDLLSIVIHII